MTWFPHNKEHAPKDKTMYGPLSVVVLTLFIFFGAQTFAYILMSILVGVFGISDGATADWFESSALSQMIFSILASGLVIASVAWLLKRRGFSLRDVGLKKPHLGDIGRTLLVYVGYLAAFVVITVVAKALVPSLDLDQEQFNFDAISKTAPNLFFLFVSLVILPPIMEEILTRGFLYTGLRSKLKVVPAAIITSIIFAAAHLQFGEGAPLLWIAALDTFVLSLALVYLREKTGRLAAPIMLHGLKNAIAFCLLFFVV
jgi:membrane protease YdiL (CAAX protease family)